MAKIVKKSRVAVNTYVSTDATEYEIYGKRKAGEAINAYETTNAYEATNAYETTNAYKRSNAYQTKANVRIHVPGSGAYFSGGISGCVFL
ncbi:hypothetical protein NXH76_18935 [Blautia schinkii]|nr:hypothetical protein [Blautia schinkii]